VVVGSELDRDDLAVGDEEGTRALVISGSGRLAGSRGWLLRGVAGYSKASVGPEWDGVPCDEAMRCLHGIGTLNEAVGNLPASSSSASPADGATGCAGGSGSDADAMAIAGNVLGWLERELPLRRSLLRHRGRGISHRELDRQDHQERACNAPPPPPQTHAPQLQAQSVCPAEAELQQGCPAPGPVLPVVTPAVAVQALLQLPPPHHSSAAEAHDNRRRITGAICLAVSYAHGRLAAEDVPALTVTGGRIFIQDMDVQGSAYKVGVRPGDELVRIRVGGRGTPQRPECASDALARLASDPITAEEPVLALFMGFAGKFPAEVRVTSPEVAPMEKAMPPTVETLTDITSGAVFQLHDHVVFHSNRASLLIASEPGSCRESGGGGPRDLTEPNSGRTSRLEESETSESEEHERAHNTPWHVLELGDKEAKALLMDAVYDMPEVDSPCKVKRTLQRRQGSTCLWCRCEQVEGVM